MKKLKTALVVVMILLFSNAYAQKTELNTAKQEKNKKATRTYLSPVVNMVGSNINYGASNSGLAAYKKTMKGIRAGVSFQAGITPDFSLVSEIYFVMKGGKLKTNNPLTGSESALRLNTLELPVLARVHLGKFYMNAGPSIAYNLSGKQKIDNLSTKLSFANSSEGFKRFEAGLQAGGGFEFPYKQKRIALDIRYSYGLTNIARSGEMYNRALMVSVRVAKPWKTNPLGRK